MIDEKRLVEQLNELKDKCWDRAKKENNINFARKQLDISQVIGIINIQPKIGGWIPCSERLPDKGVMNPITNDYAEYLCTVCVDGFRTVRPIKFDKDGCWVNHGMNFDKYVTAWQPLPEAYHG